MLSLAPLLMLMLVLLLLLVPVPLLMLAGEPFAHVVVGAFSSVFARETLLVPLLRSPGDY